MKKLALLLLGILVLIYIKNAKKPRVFKLELLKSGTNGIQGITQQKSKMFHKKV